MDNEVKGTGNQIDFGDRIYDPRIGRWFSLDPLQSKYPNESHYGFVSNSPLLFIDPDGRDKITTIYLRTDKGIYALKVITERKVKETFMRKIFGGLMWFKSDVGVNYVIDLSKNPNGNRISVSTNEHLNYERIGVGEYLDLKTNGFFSRGAQDGSYTTQPFGFVLTGNSSGAGKGFDITGPKGEVVEHLDVGALLGNIGNYKDILDGDGLVAALKKLGPSGDSPGIMLELSDIIDKANTAFNATWEAMDAAKETLKPKNTPKPKPILIDKEVDSIPGISPQYQGDYRHYKGASEGKPDTIINYKTKPKK